MTRLDAIDLKILTALQARGAFVVMTGDVGQVVLDKVVAEIEAAEGN
jgi:hypothetical protein